MKAAVLGLTVSIHLLLPVPATAAELPAFRGAAGWGATTPGGRGGEAAVAWPTASALPAFPGAEGWGADTPGGRGGRVIYVTNLEDSGPGSLREAVMTPEPRTILFRVAGIIHLESPIFLGGPPWERDGTPYSHVTIAGQSAPGGGVIVADYNFSLTNGVHDVVIRHLRFRNSQRDLDGKHSSGDGIDIKGASRVVIDHCSVSWATDENISLEENPDNNTDITLQYNLVAEGLLHGGHESGPHSRGIQAAKGADRISIHHNFMMSNDFRNPHTPGNGLGEHLGALFPTFDVRHNMTYNSGKQDAHTKLGARVNWVGNLFVKGPDSKRLQLPMEVKEPVVDTRIFVAENASLDFEYDDQLDLVEFPDGVPVGVQAEPFPAPAVTATPVEKLAGHLLAKVGARPLDPTDRRLIDEFLAGGGAMGAPDRTHETPIPEPEAGTPAADSDLDGMPDEWETAAGLDPLDPSDGPADRDGDGYTNLEEYLDERAVELTCSLPELRVEIRDDVLSGAVRHEACMSIDIGPMVTVEREGDVELHAGREIRLHPDLAVERGARFALRIDRDL